MARFQEFVERRDTDTISAREVQYAFPFGVSLHKAVETALECVGFRASRCFLPQLIEHYTGERL